MVLVVQKGQEEQCKWMFDQVYNSPSLPSMRSPREFRCTQRRPKLVELMCCMGPVLLEECMLRSDRLLEKNSISKRPSNFECHSFSLLTTTDP